MKPRKPIPRISKARTAQNQLYTKLKAKFLDTNPYCFRCNENVPLKYRDLHHHRGRSNKLLCWIPGFRTACRKCHDWIHHNVKEAQKLGLIAGAGEWGRMPR